MADQRFIRLSYAIKLSKQLGKGILYHDGFHAYGCYRKQREDKYKNIDRRTIRKASNRYSDIRFITLL